MQHETHVRNTATLKVTDLLRDSYERRILTGFSAILRFTLTLNFRLNSSINELYYDALFPTAAISIVCFQSHGWKFRLKCVT